MLTVYNFGGRIRDEVLKFKTGFEGLEIVECMNERELVSRG